MERIPVAGPWITQKEIDYVTDAVTNAWYSNASMYHERFEKAFAEYVGVRFAVSLPHCTAAIHLSLIALGIGPGDEVIVPDITWIASAAPITYVGATPVFADIDKKTWGLSAASFEERISPRTKAVIPVDLYGGMPDYTAILKIAKANGIAIVEDAAQAVGSEFDDKKAGSFGDTGVFSFHGSKTLTTGEGGMLVTDRDDVYERVMTLRDHGRQPDSKMFWNTEIAYKYKMSSMQAALGLAQLERIDELISKKRDVFGWYKSRLDNIGCLKLNAEPEGTKNTYWMNTVILDESLGLSKEDLVGVFAQRNIDTRPFFYPLSSLPAFSDQVEEVKRAKQQNRTAYSISGRGINLPSSLSLTEEEVECVCNVLLELLKR